MGFVWDPTREAEFSVDDQLLSAPPHSGVDASEVADFTGPTGSVSSDWSVSSSVNDTTGGGVISDGEAAYFALESSVLKVDFDGNILWESTPSNGGNALDSCNPAIADGILWHGYGLDLVGFDITDGSEVVSTAAPSGIIQSPILTGKEGGTDYLFFTDFNGFLRKYNIATDTVEWANGSYSIGEAKAPILTNNHVIISAGGAIRKFDRSDGTEVNASSFTSAAEYSHIYSENGYAYASGGGSVYEYDPTDMSQNRRYFLSGSYGTSQLIGSENYLYVWDGSTRAELIDKSAFTSVQTYDSGTEADDIEYLYGCLDEANNQLIQFRINNDRSSNQDRVVSLDLDNPLTKNWDVETTFGIDTAVQPIIFEGNLFQETRGGLNKFS